MQASDGETSRSVATKRSGEHYEISDEEGRAVVAWSRRQFPYWDYEAEIHEDHGNDTVFSKVQNLIFMESAGGAQVPRSVIEETSMAMASRWREVTGGRDKKAAKDSIRALLGADPRACVSLGSNTTQLFQHLAKALEPMLLFSKPEPESVDFCSPGDVPIEPTSTLPEPGVHKAELPSSSQQAYLGMHSQAPTPTQPNLKSSRMPYPLEAVTRNDLPEIIVCEASHSANITPWLQLAEKVGARIRWWRVGENGHHPSLAALKNLLSPSTRVVALTHVSNVLGRVFDIESCAALCKEKSPLAQIVVDGVAYVPHRFADLASLQAAGVDWYAISLHKLYGPHLGAIVGRVPETPREANKRKYCDGHNMKEKNVVVKRSRQTESDKSTSTLTESAHCKDRTANVGSHNGTSQPYAFARGPSFRSRQAGCDETPTIQLLDTLGTVSLEACAGVRGLETYFRELGEGHGMKYAWARIEAAERGPQAILLEALRKSKNVYILGDESSAESDIVGERLPTVSFVHSRYSPEQIVAQVTEAGIAARCGNFLAPRLLSVMGDKVGTQVARFSLCHYNTEKEVHHLVKTLQAMQDW